MKVLVIGDCRRWTGKLVDYLNLLDGMTAEAVPDIGEFAVCRNTPDVDLLILDIGIVTGDSLKNLQSLAEIEEIPRILVLTVHPKTGLATGIGSNKKISYLSKDLGIDSVLEAIRNEELVNE